MRPTALLPGVALRYLGRLRFPALFAVTAGLFLLDLVVPDAIPMVDELLLGLGAALLASWKKRREAGEPEDAPP